MLARIRDKGRVVLCDNCQTEIQDNTSVVLWKKDGPPKATVVTVHKRCEDSSFVKMLLPHGHRQQPLSQFLEGILEAISI
jgi:hypothetical protein